MTGGSPVSAEFKGNVDATRWSQETVRDVQNGMLALAHQLAGVIQRLAPTGATANLRGSFVASGREVTGGYAVSVGTPYDYALYVETGTVPHWAPIQPLIEWVEGKLQPHVKAIGLQFIGGRAAPARKGTRVLRGDKRQKEILRVAYAIQAKIHEEGTRGQYIIQGACEEMGLNYSVTETPDSRTYYIDIAEWIGRHLRPKG